MKKKYWQAASIVILGISLFAISGCTQTKNNSLRQSQTFMRQDVNNLILNISEVKTAKIKNENKKVLLTIDIENNSSEVKDIGSIDFYLSSDGKEIDVDADSNSFGEPVDPGKELKKKLIFIIPEKTSKVKLVYKPKDKVLASWELTIPNYDK